MNIETKYCEQKGIELYFNVRDHCFSISSLLKEVAEKESKKRFTV
jgi:glycerol-3-phosphate cytidylyltransferase